MGDKTLGHTLLAALPTDVAEELGYDEAMAAAEAVKRECARNVANFMEAADNRLADAECDVIEAAKVEAFRLEQNAAAAHGQGMAYTATPSQVVLLQAVRALDALTDTKGGE